MNLKEFYFYRPRRVRIRIRPRVRTRRKTKAFDHANYTAHKNTARELIVSRLQHFAAEYARLDPTYAQTMQYRRVAIRNQRSRWGSCSAQKNLNFNYRLVHLTPELRDYVVVHELCHLVELNHSPRFWALVERMIPNAQALSHQVRRMEIKDLVAQSRAVDASTPVFASTSQSPVV